MSSRPADHGAGAAPLPAVPAEPARSGEVVATAPANESQAAANTEAAAGERTPPQDSSSRTTLGDEGVHLWLSGGDRMIAGVLAAGILVLMLVHWVRLSGWGMQPVEIERAQPRSFVYRIDINRATWVEWAQLDGVGEVLADRIVSERETHGPFRSIDDLRRVKGIGPKTLEKIRPWLTE